MSHATGRLFLIPVVLAPDTAHRVISPEIREILPQIHHFYVENVRTARRFISSLQLGLNIPELQFAVLDKKTKAPALKGMLDLLAAGQNVGIMSEAGCPGIADPGSLAVRLAHENGLEVVPLAGPSAMFLTLMASGFNGQSFTFHGYLPIDKKERQQRIHEIEKESARLRRTQLFMETPFRNDSLFQDLLKHAHPETALCVAAEITSENAFIQTKKIHEWKKAVPELHKRPTVFALYAAD
ncbi:uroporphyrin-III C/tetrapyrrole methyltransferase [Nitritalea halalkaliphila LW7]|uniref:Uroporphyrin-III C/tetrapyrrole methyltransferase n=1 Tax=Nitritalea halalkaliphila LW7 TaxID=1189621 RepID=I5BWD2_9BACT|nr:SAM-dependent methyltransferase [Nitritalea halalkaliphila]EIM73884.1 uroporphyrin-III C/tetrapyrrole methyltransferase [Nitritalea halalkaliphila LW7]